MGGKCLTSDVRGSWDLGPPHTGQYICHGYPTRDRSGALDRSVTCDRFFEEAGSALIYGGDLGARKNVGFISGGKAGEERVKNRQR